jgi:ATP-binding cassette subfamily F protein 3
MKPLLEAQNLTKVYGRQAVLNGLSFVISEGAHIGLIGRNGAGKTTLLKILSGDEESDSGTIRLMPWAKLGVLRQDEIMPTEGTSLDFLSGSSGKPEWECAKLASRFGLKPHELVHAPATLSGGYQMRLKLVRMLLEDPNLLLLDEPVNYLDLPTLLLLEAFLRDYKGAFLMTSHDREALQNVCTSTWEIAAGTLAEFPGDVETYLDWKEEQAEYARRTNKRLKREIASAQAFVDRFRAKSTLATRAQSKMKHIAKLRNKLKALGTDLPVSDIRIPSPTIAAGPAVRCVNLSIGYGDRVVARDINLDIPRGIKVAIVGENGQGKTTLLKTLAGELPPIAGDVKWWHRANVGYFSQQSGETTYDSETVLQALSRAAPTEASGERILSVAGAFLFREDDLEKTCGVLSGGERARVRLAQLVLRAPNVLILDEPTNHLDAETVETLARALQNYAGTVLVVSHARTFMNAFVTAIYEVHDGAVRQYPGTYEEYVADLAAVADESVHAGSGTPSPVKAEKRERALLEKQRRRTQQTLETAIKKLDTEKSEILAYYFENPTDYAPSKAQRLMEIDEELKTLEKQWYSTVE